MATLIYRESDQNDVLVKETISQVKEKDEAIFAIAKDLVETSSPYLLSTVLDLWFLASYNEGVKRVFYTDKDSITYEWIFVY